MARGPPARSYEAAQYAQKPYPDKRKHEPAGDSGAAAFDVPWKGPSFHSPLHRSNEKTPEKQQKGTNSSPSSLSIA
ncbi:hypothetical protein [Azospirillum brasilense]|uniref:hypothetical protein n=1 Tax=Azospirillum brasilense TaxID=192 RepID=UPI001177D071|nr:hypothetical protein [Azospirillum brasilense]